MTPADPALRARRWSCPAGRPGSSSGAGARGGAGNARHLLPRGSSPHDAAAGPAGPMPIAAQHHPQGHRRASCGISAGWGPVGDLEEKASAQVNGRERRAGGIVCKAAPYWPRARLAGSVLLAARSSWPSPSSQGQAAARSLHEPGHGGHGQGRAATRSTGEMQGTQSSPNHSRWPPLGA